MSVTDKSFVKKEQYGKVVLPVKSFPFPNKAYVAKEGSQKILKDIDDYLLKHSGRVAAVIIEPIQGAAGFIVPSKSFLIGLDKLTKKHKVIFICDEIQMGVFRTGSFYYINQVNIDPDIVLLGKSLAGGYYPLSAVIGRRELFKSIPLSGSGFDSTFANNLLGIAIANKILDFIENKKVSRRLEAKSKKIMIKLKALRRFKFIKDVSGIGMAFSFRIEGLENSTEVNAKLAKEIRKTAFENHLLIQTAGVDGNYIKISPSLLISDEEINIAFDRLNRSMDIINQKIRS